MRWKYVVGAIFVCVAGGVCFLSLKRSPRPSTVASSPSVIIFPQPTPQLPPTTNATLPENISAQSVAIYDVKSQQLIIGKNEHLRLMPASTTKMMTALVAWEEYDPDEIITVTRASEAIGHSVDLVSGEQLSVKDMITAMMVNSGNDAAVSLADHHPGGYQTFVNLMNQKVVAFGLKDTHFSNVSGVEADDHYSSAFDLAVIADHLMRIAPLRQIVGTKETKVTTVNTNKIHQLKNLNQLLWNVPGVIGVKTGWTEIAGDCLVTYVSRDHDIITVVLNSQDRFKDSTTLIEWAYKSLSW